MKNGFKNHLLKLKKRKKKMNKIRIFDGFECLLAFILLSVHNYVRSFNVRPIIRSDKVVDINNHDT